MQAFERVVKTFPRAMSVLRAARLSEHVVVIGGQDDGYNSRDEVSLNFYQEVISFHV